MSSIEEDENVTVLGCGCRYRHIGPNLTRYEHLCDDHKNEYILKLYNAQSVVRHMREERMKKLKEAVHKNKIKDKKLVIDNNSGGGSAGGGSGGSQHNKPDKGKDK